MSFRFHLNAAAIAVVLGLLIFLQWSPGFPDPDSFYHAKMALLLRDDGILQNFPWFHFTSLPQVFPNPHLLYHLLLIPFVTFFPPLLGMKISAICFGALAFYALYRFLKTFSTPFPAAWILTAALSTGFLYRMSLPRAPSLGISMLLLITWALLLRRPWIVFWSMFLFVFLYHGYPLALLCGAAVFLAEVITTSLEGDTWRQGMISTMKKTGKTLLALLGGLSAGLVVNPFFPQNIWFAITDIFKIGVINYQETLPVGREWYPLSPEEFIVHDLPTALAALGVLVVFVIAAPHLRLRNTDHLRAFLACFLIGGMMTLLTLRSMRFVEYAIPFLVASLGILFGILWPFFEKEIRPWIVSPWSTLRLASKLGWSSLILFPLVTLPIATLVTHPPSYRLETYKPASTWIQEHVPEGEIVFHNSWDFSSILFYLDTEHRYVVGLDPTFFYEAYPEPYHIWEDLVFGRNPNVSTIVTVFSARVVVVDDRIPGAERFKEHLQSSGFFEKIPLEQGEGEETVHVFVCTAKCPAQTPPAPLIPRFL